MKFFRAVFFARPFSLSDMLMFDRSCGECSSVSVCVCTSFFALRRIYVQYTQNIYYNILGVCVFSG